MNADVDEQAEHLDFPVMEVLRESKASYTMYKKTLMVNEPASNAGWIYAVRAGLDVKLGFTTNANVYAYLTKNYSRTYSSWTALQLLLVPDCRYAEKGLLLLLKKYLQHDKHEIVQCDDDKVISAFHKMAIFFYDDADRVVADMEEAKRLWGNKQGRPAKRKQPASGVIEMKREARAKLKLQKLDVLKAQIEADEKRSMEEVERQVEDAVGALLSSTVEKSNPSDFVKAKELYAAYNSRFKELQRNKRSLLSASDFRKHLERVLEGVVVKKHHCYSACGARTSVGGVVLGYKNRL